MKLNFVASALVLAGALTGGSAMADTILVFGQLGTSQTITATVNGAQTQTTIVGTDIPIEISAFGAAAPATPFSGFLDLNLFSTGAASAPVPGTVLQMFSGSFSFNSLANNTGTNYLSGTFTNAVFGSGSAMTISGSEPSFSVAFSSGVLTTLGSPRAISFSFTNVLPAASIVGTTLAGFQSNVSGNASAFNVPEPGTIALIGAALLGLGVTRRRASV